MKVSIVILNYKSEGLTRYCLKNLYSAGINLDNEIIVVDNASGTNELGKIKKQFPDVKCLDLAENKGFSAGNNVGIKESKGEYVIIINPDVIVFPGVIEKLVEFMEENQNVGIAGPKLMNPDGSVQFSCLRFPDWKMPLYRRTPLGKLKFVKNYLSKYLMQEFDHEETKTVDWLFGACLIVRKTALEKVGMLDERYFLYIQDTDWCRRFWEKGFKVYYLADIKVLHYHHRESALNPGIKGLLSYVTRVHIKDFYRYISKFKGMKSPNVN